MTPLHPPSTPEHSRYAPTVARLACVAALWGGSAAAQSIDAALTDALEEQIDAQVEQQLEQSIADAVAEQVEAGAAEAVEQQVESAVTGAVEQQIEGAVASSVEQAVESGVAQAVEQQVESGVTAAVESQLESGLVDAVTEGLESSLEQALDGIAQTVQSGVGGLADAVGERLEPVVPGGDEQGDAGGEPNDAPPLERFVADFDAAGRAIEGDVWVILVPAEHVARIDAWGFTIRAREDLAALERVLLRVDAPEDRDIAQAALDLALDAPGTLVDFNHVYRGGAQPAAAPRPTPPYAGRPLPAAAPAGVPTIAVGLIDSAVAAHPAFAAADIVQRDFVPFVGSRPVQHGTAVASILIGPAGRLPAGARLYAAGVFFEDESGAAAATTASLVAALGWLAAADAAVVNMSLAGPPNRVLQAAVAEVAARGAMVVAAVGNNGPVGEPLYPAAYADVVAVTAVDSAHRVYRYAGRGPHVAFAAPGVRIKVARAGGEYDTESGTSMAAPYAAATIARSLAVLGPKSRARVLAKLEAEAVDLGAPGFDEIFGHGLIAADD